MIREGMSAKELLSGGMLTFLFSSPEIKIILLLCHWIEIYVSSSPSFQTFEQDLQKMASKIRNTLISKCSL